MKQYFYVFVWNMWGSVIFSACLVSQCVCLQPRFAHFWIVWQSQPSTMFDTAPGFGSPFHIVASGWNQTRFGVGCDFIFTFTPCCVLSCSSMFLLLPCVMCHLSPLYERVERNRARKISLSLSHSHTVKAAIKRTHTLFLPYSIFLYYQLIPLKLHSVKF